MAKQSGKLTYVEFGGVDLTDVLRDFSLSEGENDAESTAGGDVYENYVATTKTLTASATFVMLTAATGGTAILAQMRPGTIDPLIWGMEGSSAGLPKGGASMRVTKFDRKSSYKDVITADVEWKMDGTDLDFDDSVDVF